MKRSLLFTILALSTIMNAQWKNLTVEEAVVKSPFKIASLGEWKWVDNSDEYIFLSKEDGSLYNYNLVTGDTTLFISIENLVYNGNKLELDDFIYHPVSNKVILVTERTNIWRHSRSAKYFIYDVAKETISQLANGDILRNVKFSPDGKSLAYVNIDNNLYAYHIEVNKERRLTKDGSFEVLNGHFGWVYEEEFGSYDSYRWSSDSKFIAFVREDQTYVKRFPMMDELYQYPKVYWHHYPKVGETNPVLNIGVANVSNGKTKWLDISASEEMYHPRIKWLSNSQSLVVTRINRHQNKLELVKYDIGKKSGIVIWQDVSEAWVNLTDDIFFLEDGSFITLSERSGFNHIYHFSGNGELINQVTNGNWEVTGITVFDEENGRIYLNGKKDSVLESNLYSVNIDGSDFKSLSVKLGWHTVHFSPSNNYYIDSYSTANDPLEITLHKSSGEKVRDISITDKSQFVDYGFQETKFIQIPTSDDGTLLNAMITLPRDFDPNKKYPVIIFGYSGPGSQSVLNRQGRGYWNKYMNQEGFIYFSLDPRGTGGRGTDFKYLSYLDISKWVVNDQVEGAKYLRSLPYVDENKIGIWGWSGGGTMTTLCMTLGAPNFNIGVSVAGNYDFRLYDTIWTERYMGLLNENEEGYRIASPITYAELLQDKLLVVHGTMDDNVHQQHATLLMEAFVNANKNVDYMTYASRNHRINTGNAYFHLWTKITNYFKDNL